MATKTRLEQAIEQCREEAIKLAKQVKAKRAHWFKLLEYANETRRREKDLWQERRRHSSPEAKTAWRNAVAMIQYLDHRMDDIHDQIEDLVEQINDLGFTLEEVEKECPNDIQIDSQL